MSSFFCNPFFSVIIPCYNCAGYVQEAINSILDQSFGSFEIIAINDGSLDFTLEVLKNYEQQDERIRVFTKDNGGYCSAVNMGLEYVRGRYFTLIGSDDTLTPGLFENVYNEISGTVPDMVGFKTNKIKNHKKIGIDGFTDFEIGVYEKDTTIKAFQQKYPSETRILSVRDTSKFYKSDLLGDLRYFGKYGFDADGIFAMLFSHKCTSFACLPIEGYNWTLREDSLSGKRVTVEVYEDRLDNWMRFYKIIAGLKHSDITENEKNYVDYYYDKAWEYAKLITLHSEKMSFLEKHTRFIFKTMRRYGITVGRDFSEKIRNYFYLIFPKYNRNLSSK